MAKNKVEKIIKVPITLENGDKRTLLFQVIPDIDLDDGGSVFSCDKVCPYGLAVCQNLKNPLKLDDPLESFLEFCSNLPVAEEGVGDDRLVNFMPVEGTIEENLYDVDNVYQDLIKKNHLVGINEVIDSVCKDTCMMYTEQHDKCSPRNSMCFLQDLLKNKNYDPALLKKLEEAESKKEDNNGSAT